MISFRFGSIIEKNVSYLHFDFLSFRRHHVYKKKEGQIELTELGPRFEMKCKKDSIEVLLNGLDVCACSVSNQTRYY